MEQKMHDIAEPIPKHTADRFGISGFRTEKFVNDD
jgi:hypothetical protein